jgi:hypothetical protein
VLSEGSLVGGDGQFELRRNRVDLVAERVESAIHVSSHSVEASVNRVEACVDGIEPGVDPGEASIHMPTQTRHTRLNAPTQTRQPTVHVFLQLRNGHSKAADHSIVIHATTMPEVRSMELRLNFADLLACAAKTSQNLQPVEFGVRRFLGRLALTAILDRGR